MAAKKKTAKKTTRKRALKVWTTTDFKGINPVPCAAVVVAATEKQARALLDPQLPFRDSEYTLQSVDLSEPNATVLSDGDY